MRPHYKLEAWKNSMDLVDEIYDLTKQFPREEKFGLISQMRRCAVSVPSNIAEGAARNSSTEFAHFINMAKGSLSELETQLLIAKRQNFTTDISDTLDLVKKVASQLAGLHKYLKDE